MPTKKTILICPLNWGLGHSTRMIPIIDSALKNGNTVIIASDGNALTLLQNRYSYIQSIELPSLSIEYGTGFFSLLKFICSIPRILYWIKKDNKALKSILDQNKIDLIISDNRWGLWNKKIKSIFVTHQLMIKLPFLISFLEKTLFIIQQQLLKPFDEIWIPDYEDSNVNISGDLSHKFKAQKSTRFIGLLSQFNEDLSQKTIIYDYAIILSGPEPHRTILEKRLIELFIKTDLKTIIIGGTFSNTIFEKAQNIEYLPFADTETLQKIYSQSDRIICRSGYTSLMDLIRLRKTALLIPTPSQTEQEYLAKYVSDKGWFQYVKQNMLNEIPFYELDTLHLPSFKGIELNLFS